MTVKHLANTVIDKSNRQQLLQPAAGFGTIGISQ